MATAKRKVAKKKVVSRSANWQKLMEAKAARIAKVRAKRDSYGSGLLDLLLPDDDGKRVFARPVGINTNIDMAMYALKDFNRRLDMFSGKPYNTHIKKVEKEFEKLNKILSKLNQEFTEIEEAITYAGIPKD